ncbi:hypothetical protein [Haloferula sargassicola]|uniref:Uncharacterized protein n=1 Tax=Haloferula sargassicola TaxID=490096 RepID=A0ABP9UHL5_9BACT
MHGWDIEEALGAGLAEGVKRGFALFSCLSIAAVLAVGTSWVGVAIERFLPSAVDEWLVAVEKLEWLSPIGILAILVTLVACAVRAFASDEFFPREYFRFLAALSIFAVLAAPRWGWERFISLGVLVGCLGSIWFVCMAIAQARWAKYQAELMALKEENQRKREELGKKFG